MSRAVWALACYFLIPRLAWADVPARATTTDREALVLSLDEALRLADERSPLVRRSVKELGIARAMRVGAAVLLPANPVATMTFGARRDSSASMPPSQGPEGTGRLEQMIEVGGQRGRRIAEAERGIDVAQIRVDVARAETRARVRAAYLGALIAQQYLEYTRQQESLGQQVFESAQARFLAGAGTDVDRNIAEVERGRLTQDRVTAFLLVGEWTDKLRRAVGMPAGRPLVLTTGLELPPEVTAALDALLARAHKRRAELHALEASTLQLDAAVVRWRRERVPSPTLFFDVMSQQPGQLYLGGGVALPLPLWRRQQGEIAVAEAGRELAREDLAIFEEQLGIEVEQAYRTARGLREAVLRWQDVSVPAAERNFELVTQGWRSGKFDLFRVVQAARDAAEARRRRLEMLGALWDATITLDRVTGEAP